MQDTELATTFRESEADRIAEREIAEAVLATVRTDVIADYQKMPPAYILDFALVDRRNEIVAFVEAKHVRSIPFDWDQRGLLFPLLKVQTAMRYWREVGVQSFAWIRFQGGDIHEAMLPDSVDWDRGVIWFGNPKNRDPETGKMRGEPHVVLPWSRFRLRVPA